jgi:hypothetical protein
MAEGVIDATVEEARRHPYLVVGGLVAAVAVLWYLSGSSAAPAGQNFTFSYGPSDAQVLAGTQLAIAQQADQTAVTLAGMQTTAQTGIAQDYFGYLTNNSANTLAAVVNTNGTAATIAQAGDWTQAQIAATTTGAATQQAQIASYTSVTNTAGTNAAAVAMQGNANATTLAVAQDNNATSYGIAVNNNATTLGVQASNERIAADQIGTNATVALTQANDNYNLGMTQTNNANQIANAQLGVQGNQNWFQWAAAMLRGGA